MVPPPLLYHQLPAQENANTEGDGTSEPTDDGSGTEDTPSSVSSESSTTPDPNDTEQGVNEGGEGDSTSDNVEGEEQEEEETPEDQSASISPQAVGEPWELKCGQEGEVPKITVVQGGEGTESCEFKNNSLPEAKAVALSCDTGSATDIGCSAGPPPVQASPGSSAPFTVTVTTSLTSQTPPEATITIIGQLCEEVSCEPDELSTKSVPIILEFIKGSFDVKCEPQTMRTVAGKIVSSNCSATNNYGASAGATITCGELSTIYKLCS